MNTDVARTPDSAAASARGAAAAPQGGRRAPRSLHDRTIDLSTLAITVGLTAWTVVLMAVPGLREVEWARARVSPESIGAVVAILALALAYLRYSVTSSASLLFVALAFVAITFSQVVLSVLLDPATVSVEGEQHVYFWMAGRFVAGTLLLAGALLRGDRRPAPRSPARTFLAGSLGVVALLAGLDLVLWAARDALPALSSGGRGVVPAEPTPVGVALGVSGTILYLGAAVAYLGRSSGQEVRWMPPALVVAAFAHLHYMLLPSILLDRISSGDALRIAFAAVLLAGIVWELRLSLRSERERAEDLAFAYARERDRVRDLEEVERSRAELFGILTHELAHPVASLRGFVVSLRDRWEQLDAQTRNRALARMDQESKRLRDLAEEVVSVAQLDAPALSLAIRPERVNDLVREAADAATGLEGRLVVRVEPPAGGASVSVDRARVLQVFRNLLSNAVKYTPDGTPVELDVAAREGEVLFRVRDRGPGIAAEHLPRLFQRFSRIHGGESDPPGSGLGLYISRRIIEAHGGRIWAESEPGRGSCFSFAIPTEVAR